MIFIFKKKYPVQIKIYKLLNSIYGIGPTKTRLILTRLGATYHTTLFDLKRFRAVQLNVMLNQIKNQIGIFVKNREMNVHLRRVMTGSYRGLHLMAGLPVNGQRRKANAKTAKRLNKVRSEMVIYLRRRLMDNLKKAKDEKKAKSKKK